jgi:hypothetical protein
MKTNCREAAYGTVPVPYRTKHTNESTVFAGKEVIYFFVIEILAL